MKRRIAILSVLFVLAAATAVLAADVTGKWVAQVPGRGGQTREQTFNLKQDGSKVTGTVSGRQGDTPIADGKVEGDTISFTVTQSFNGNEFKSTYTGKISGDEIKFTRTTSGGNAGPQEFTAKRSK
ncbi:MAG TPA: hypothetical protein VFC63_08650 [Blastocatellia bacterium]|nr:hypothetical protein [Blastocatellia bacterium]